MATQNVQGFSGINRRAEVEIADPRALYVGDNVEVTLGRSLKSRDGLRKLFDLHPESVGLYTAGGVLRAAIPGGRGLPSEAVGQVLVQYDRLGGAPTVFSDGLVSVSNGSNTVSLSGGSWPLSVDGARLYIQGRAVYVDVVARLSAAAIQIATPWPGPDVVNGSYRLSGVPPAYDLGVLTRVTAAESFGLSKEQGAYPYIVVERVVDPLDPAMGVRFEHHWITDYPGTSDNPPHSFVELPFTPGPSIVKLNGRVWAIDDTTSEVRFSSVEFGPRDWLAPKDAGFISTVSNAAGSRKAIGLGVYNDNLAVIFRDSTQVWKTSEDAYQIRFLRAMTGPGTDVLGSVANVRGDLFYFTAGGFRSLHTQTITGELQEQDDIGADIYSLTLDQRGTAVALWSQRRTSYLCAFGDTVYVYRWSPNAKIKDWSRWKLQVPVDYMVELGGNLYVRSGDGLYVFDPDYEEDVEFTAQFHMLSGRDRHTRKRWDFLEVVQDGTSSIDFSLQPSDPSATYAPGPTITGSTTTIDRIFVGVMAPSVGVRFRGRGRWRLDSFGLTFQQLAW